LPLSQRMSIPAIAMSRVGTLTSSLRSSGAPVAPCAAACVSKANEPLRAGELAKPGADSDSNLKTESRNPARGSMDSASTLLSGFVTNEPSYAVSAADAEMFPSDQSLEVPEPKPATDGSLLQNRSGSIDLLSGTAIVPEPMPELSARRTAASRRLCREVEQKDIAADGPIDVFGFDEQLRNVGMRMKELHARLIDEELCLLSAVGARLSVQQDKLVDRSVEAKGGAKDLWRASDHAFL